jgi:hypothetical protein
MYFDHDVNKILCRPQLSPILPGGGTRDEKYFCFVVEMGILNDYKL